MKPYYEYLEFEKLDIIQEKITKILTDRFGDFSDGCKVIHVDKSLTCAITEIDELMDELENRRLLRYVIFFTFFVIEPKSDNGKSWEGGGWPIHTDGSLYNGFLNDSRLVVPIYNTAGTLTRFYKTDHPGTYIDEGGQGETLYTIWDKEDCTEVANYELTKPVIINTHIPHGIDGNTNNRPRISLGINFNRKIKLL